MTWADVIRKTYNDGGVDEIISTRRLVHIAEAYGIFRNKMKAIAVCTNRFDDDTKTSFVDLYSKVDSGASVEQILADKKKAEEDGRRGRNKLIMGKRNTMIVRKMMK